MLNYHDIMDFFHINMENITIIERISNVSIKLQCNSIAFSAQNLQNLFESIPNRDQMTINLIYGDESLAITLITSALEINTFLNKLNRYIDDDDCFEVEIKITKNIHNNILSVYFLDFFFNWLLNLDLLSFLKVHNSVLTDSRNFLIVECFNDVDYLVTNNFAIIPTEKVKDISLHLSDRKDIISKRNQICRFSGFENKLTPDDFNIIDTNCDKAKLCYEKAKYILSIAYLADECKFEEKNMLFSLYGYRTRNKIVSYDSITSENINQIFYSIYKWLYVGGNIHDKSQIVRNIISLHCKYSDILRINQNVFETIKSNYNLYLKDNVKDYLRLKKDIVNSLQTYCDKISESINTFAGSFKTNFIAILGYVATILFSKGITKDTSKIFTPDIATLTSFVLFGSIIIFFLCRLHISFQKNYYDTTISALKKSYQDIIEEDEINGLIDNNSLLNVANTNYRRGTKIVSAIWLVFIISSFIALDYWSGNTKLLFLINLF